MRGPLALSVAVKIVDRTLELLGELHQGQRAHGALGPDAVLFGQSEDGLQVVLWPGDASVPAAYRASGLGPGPQADVFAVGVLMHHMVSGRAPAPGAPLQSLVPGSLQDVPDELDQLVLKMVHPAVEHRLSSVSQIRERLENLEVDSTLSGARVAALRAQMNGPLPVRQVMLSAPHAPDADPFADTLIGSRAQIEGLPEHEEGTQDTLLGYPREPADPRLAALDARTELLPESPPAPEARAKWVVMGVLGGLALGGAVVALMSLF